MAIIGDVSAQFRTGVLLAAAMCLGPGAAGAQERGRVGIAMGYPSLVGVVWHVADRLAIRPEISIARTTGDSSVSLSFPGSELSSESTQVGVGMSALVFVGRWDALRTYVSPRFVYSRATTTSSSSSLSATEGTSAAYLTTGSFGAQYSLGSRFGVFGELGLTYTAAKTASRTTDSGISPITGLAGSSTTGRVESHRRSLSTASGVGVIFYF